MKLPRIEKGKAPSMLNAKVAMEVIGSIEDLYNAKFVPQGTGKIVAAGGQVIFDFSGLVATVEQLLNNQRGIDSSNGGNGPGGTNGNIGTNGVDGAVRTLLAGASIVCNEDGTISFILP